MDQIEFTGVVRSEGEQMPGSVFVSLIFDNAEGFPSPVGHVNSADFRVTDAIAEALFGRKRRVKVIVIAE